MSSALTLAYKEHPQDPKESDQEYDDRITIKALLKLHRKKNRTEEEEKELKYLEGECIAVQVSRGGHLPSIHSDKEMRPAAKRLHEELSEQFGEKSPLKTMLIDRLVAAWNMANVYETQLSIAKYTKNPNNTISISYNESAIKFLCEARKGIESANDQIIRLAQTIQNLTNPPIQIKATNAFIAQNQQVNQNPPPKDLATISTPSSHEETDPRTE